MKSWRHVRYWLWGFLVLSGIALGAASWASWIPLFSDSRELVYVIPKGNWARRSAGEKIEAVPSQIRLTLGVKDILVIKNEDDVPQMFGPVLIMPGQTFQLPFRTASSYQFLCTLHASGQLSIVVEPTPQLGWARLRWRVARLLNHRGTPVKGERGEAML